MLNRGCKRRWLEEIIVGSFGLGPTVRKERIGREFFGLVEVKIFFQLKIFGTG